MLCMEAVRLLIKSDSCWTRTVILFFDITMSPYGEILRPRTQLESKTFPGGLTVHHVSLSQAKEMGFVEVMYQEFRDEVENGLTYPQEECNDPGTFETYFFGGDVFVAVDAEKLAGFYYVCKTSHRCAPSVDVLTARRSNPTTQAALPIFAMQGSSSSKRNVDKELEKC